MLVLLHSGQTGVERGAALAALANGIPTAGFMPVEERDELGPVPADISASLTRGLTRGPRQAVKSNVMIASGVVLVVPDSDEVETFTAMAAVLQAIRSAHVDHLVTDPTTSRDFIAEWTRGLRATSGSTRIYVTGPRATRWTDGEGHGRRIVTAMAML